MPPGGFRCEPLESAGLSGKLGGLLSNPPYIPRAQVGGVMGEDRGGGIVKSQGGRLLPNTVSATWQGFRRA